MRRNLRHMTNTAAKTHVCHPGRLTRSKMKRKK
jgi:hypothetical protein